MYHIHRMYPTIGYVDFKYNFYFISNTKIQMSTYYRTNLSLLAGLTHFSISLQYQSTRVLREIFPGIYPTNGSTVVGTQTYPHAGKTWRWEAH